MADTDTETGGETKRPRVATFGPEGVTQDLPGVRAHKDVLVKTDEVLDFAALKNAAEAEGGGQSYLDVVRDLSRRRRAAARRRRNGEYVIDHEAESMSFAGTLDMREVRRMLDFPVTVQVPQADGRRDAITTSAFALLSSAMAVEDVNLAYEAVPTISEHMIGQEIDDNQPNTEIGGVLDFKHADPLEVPRTRPEMTAYLEVGAGEERYTALSWHDGYLRRFSQQFVDRAPSQVYSQLMDLGTHMRELIEMRSLLKICDYYGSKSSSGYFHAMIRERAAAALFSSTANTPGTRVPSGTRILNNALADTTDLANLRAVLAGMKNSRGFPISNKPKVILVPDALWETAWTQLKAVMQPGIFNEPNFWGPSGPMSLTLLSSPYVDLMSTTAWYAGDPKNLFVRKWALRPETAVFGGTGTEAFVTCRQAMVVRTAWDMDVAARDYVGWVQNLAGETSPADE